MHLISLQLFSFPTKNLEQQKINTSKYKTIKNTTLTLNIIIEVTIEPIISIGVIYHLPVINKLNLSNRSTTGNFIIKSYYYSFHVINMSQEQENILNFNQKNK